MAFVEKTENMTREEKQIRKESKHLKEIERKSERDHSNGLENETVWKQCWQ